MPQPGSQTAFLTCPYWEVLYEGTRGPGKTDALIMDFAQHVGEGYGPAWRGVLFRETYPQLSDVIARTKKWFTLIFPEAKYNATQSKWVFPEGEELLFRHMSNPDDYWKYHGHEYPWIGWEELTNWVDGACYEAMKSTNRSSTPGVPKKYRSTCNPWGPGHNYWKTYFIDPAPPMTKIYNSAGEIRMRIHGSIIENKILLKANPEYLTLLDGLTDPNQRKAWREGDWDIVAGGYFTDVWYPDKQVTEPITDKMVPQGWQWRRSFDWGSSKPASLGIYLISDGTPLKDGRHFPRGSIIRVEEWYACEKNSRGITVPDKGLKLSNRDIGRYIQQISGDRRYYGCIADPSIFTEQGGPSIYEQIKKGYPGLHFARADNDRIAGWQTMRMMLSESMRDKPESPGLWICSNCVEWLRTVPVLMRDDKKLDDIDTNMEDHIGDECRYMCQSTKKITRSRELNI